jgi:hypothetical protein
MAVFEGDAKSILSNSGTPGAGLGKKPRLSVESLADNSDNRGNLLMRSYRFLNL